MSDETSVPGDDEPIRYYTVEEANAVLGEVRALVETLHAAHAAMEERQEEVTTTVPTNGGGAVHRAFLDAAETAAAALDELGARGIVVRDPASGLIDFYASRDGEDVFLCWRLGEDAVEWWHPVETGFAGRQPL